MASYHQLPTKFDYTRYYLDQAGGAPSFPVFRARQRGGSFLAPFIRRHGIPFLKWIGKQAASLASGVGNTYLNKGGITKSEMKDLLKKQGKEAAHSMLDNIKQQVGSGTMTHRRDARLATLVPMTTEQRDGILTNQHRLRPPALADGVMNMFSMKPKSRKTASKRTSRTNQRSSKTSKRTSSASKKKTRGRKGKGKTKPKKKKGQSNKMPAGLRKYLTAVKKAKQKGGKNSTSASKGSSRVTKKAKGNKSNMMHHTIFS